jgi:hypothetical protein
LGADVAVRRADLAAASKAATGELADAVRQKVSAHAAGASVEAALVLHGESRGARLSRLFELVSGSVPERMTRILEVMDTLRRELPDVLKRSPLKLRHLGFTSLEALVQYLGESLFWMETSAASRTEFVRGIKGWRWNLVGRLLFERLVKFHPRLDKLFRGLAADVVMLLNRGVATRPRALVDIEGRPRAATPTFGKPEKVVEFRLVGADGVERAFTDFGFVSRNRQGWWAVLPIEIKMPSALSGVAQQFSEFLERLIAGQEVVAIIERDGALVRETVKPDRLLFLRDQPTQIAVAPISTRVAERLDPKALASNDVASIMEFEPRASESRQVQYYRIRLLILRQWLEDLVRPLTDPPK